MLALLSQATVAQSTAAGCRSSPGTWQKHFAELWLHNLLPLKEQQPAMRSGSDEDNVPSLQLPWWHLPSFSLLMCAAQQLQLCITAWPMQCMHAGDLGSPQPVGRFRKEGEA